MKAQRLEDGSGELGKVSGGCDDERHIGGALCVRVCVCVCVCVCEFHIEGIRTITYAVSTGILTLSTSLFTRSSDSISQHIIASHTRSSSALYWSATCLATAVCGSSSTPVALKVSRMVLNVCSSLAQPALNTDRR